MWNGESLINSETRTFSEKHYLYLLATLAYRIFIYAHFPYYLNYFRKSFINHES